HWRPARGDRHSPERRQRRHGHPAWWNDGVRDLEQRENNDTAALSTEPRTPRALRRTPRALHPLNGAENLARLRCCGIREDASGCRRNDRGGIDERAAADAGAGEGTHKNGPARGQVADDRRSLKLKACAIGDERATA